jgi:integrase
LVSATLPAYAVAELRRYKRQQAEELGIRQDLVCGRADGAPHLPQSITFEFGRFIAKLPLPRVTFHGLRHSHATQLLASGVHPKIAEERLGHSTITTTLDLYSHVSDTMQAEAAAK